MFFQNVDLETTHFLPFRVTYLVNASGRMGEGVLKGVKSLDFAGPDRASGAWFLIFDDPLTITG